MKKRINAMLIDLGVWMIHRRFPARYINATVRLRRWIGGVYAD